MGIDWSALGTSKLPPEVVGYLADRNIKKATAKLNNVRALNAQEMRQIGWRRITDRATGILFPPARTARIIGQSERFGKFRFAYGESARVYAPVQPNGVKLKELQANASLPLIIGEGPTRALASTAEGMYSISIPGCWNWQKDREVLPALRKYVWKDRVVMPIYDADTFDNGSVGLSFVLFGDWLADQGANVVHVRIPRVAGRKTGLDDLLAERGRKGFDALKREAWDDSAAIDKLKLTTMRKTEGGLSALFVMQNVDDVRFDQDEGEWLVYNGHLFQRQGSVPLDLETLMQKTVSSVFRDASMTKDKQRRKALTAWAYASDRAHAQNSALRLARSDPRLRVRTDELDSDANLLGVQNGVLDLRTGELTPASRAQLVTRSMNVAFESDAECPHWLKFIDEIMVRDKEMIRFMQRFVGYLLTGGNPERLIFFLYGIGRNGKSIFIETLLAMFGDYGVAAKAELIGRGRFDRDPEGAEPFKMMLRGKRYITASEVKERLRVDEAELKNLTGGDAVPARGLHAAPVQFTVIGKIVFRCNHRPQIDGSDQAVWDRIVEIPFDYRVPEDRVDTTLRQKFINELSGILNWAVQGALMYQEEGLLLPDKVKRQTQKYRETMNPVTDWLKQCTRDSGSATTNRAKAYESYLKWCSYQMGPDGQRGITPLSNITFNKELQSRDYKKIALHGSRLWKGFKLILGSDAGGGS